MDNNRLDQLMDEGWQKLKISLDAELPQKKEKKYFGLVLLFPLLKRPYNTSSSHFYIRWYKEYHHTKLSFEPNDCN